MFALESIKAKHGDCLLLYWGKDAATANVALIDGGPDTIYENHLKPRLQAIAAERKVKRVPLELVMVSHIDDDHINGILALADDIENGQAAPASIARLWHNSLEGLLDETFVGAKTASVTASVNSAFPGSAKDQWTQKVLASVPQGQLLHAFAKRKGLANTMNEPFQPLVMAKAGQTPAIFKELKLTVVAPAAAEVEKLRKEWKKKRKEGITPAAAAIKTDRSPYNLSSIVVLAEFDGKLMLLTGDARSDKILDGLKEKQLLKDGKLHVNLLKLQHHGSEFNVRPEFFAAVSADVYVVSGDNKKFPNPAKQAMEWLAEFRKDGKYVVYCPYELDSMRAIFGTRLRVPAANATSVVASL